MPRIQDLPPLDELAGDEMMIVEDSESTKRMGIGALATRAALEEVEARTPVTGLFETTVLADLFVVDDDGRKVAEYPDPAIAALENTAAIGSTYETTDVHTGAIMFDRTGRVVAELAPMEDVRAAAAQLAGLVRAPVTGVYESTDRAGLIVLDDDGRKVAEFPDPAIAALESRAAIGATFETTDVYTAAIIRDPAGRVVSEAPSQLALDAARPTTVQEVIDARGSMATLSDRLAPTVTADGAPIADQYGKSFLRQCHLRLTKRALPVPEPAQIIINLFGDSFTHNPARWSGPFAEIMAALYGDAGGGWCGFGFLPSGNVAPWTVANQPTFRQGNARPALYPTVHIGGGIGGYSTHAGPDLAMLTLAATGDAVYQGYPALPVHNGCDLLFYGSADGVIEYAWGDYVSGDPANPASYSFDFSTSLPVQGTVNTTQIADIKADMPVGAGMLRVARQAGTARLFGVNLTSDAPGVRVNKLAATGSNIRQWANAPATQWEAGVAALGAHTAIYMDGTNSQSQGYSAATWGAHLTTLVGRIRAATPGIDVLIATPPENQRPANPIPMTAYAREGRRQAMTLRTAFADMQRAFGDPANPAEYGFAGAVPLFVSDLIHPDPQTGGRLLLAEMMAMVTPF
ncbi:MAG: GDSL-type esterase/lipase family protein [Sphingobium sp.]